MKELENKIHKTLEHRQIFRRMLQLEERRRHLDDLTNLQRVALAELEKRLGSEEARTAPEFSQLKNERDEAKRQLKETIEEIESVQHRLDEIFNPYWGMVFKETQENSRFGDQVADYACIYTSRVTNFLSYSAYQYFRSPRDLLPHERKLDRLLNDIDDEEDNGA